MTFQATVSIDQNQNQGMLLNSKKMHGRKRDNAVLAPLSHVPPMMGGNKSQLSNNRWKLDLMENNYYNFDKYLLCKQF